jgi:hypothetical protein
MHERNRRQQVRRYGRREEAGMLQEKGGIPSGNPSYLVQRLLESAARLAAVNCCLHSRNPQQGCYPHVRLRVLRDLECARQQFPYHEFHCDTRTNLMG